jgi:hypothetical protein
MPAIAPAGGAFTNSTVVSISEATPNSTIHYTLDGTVPTTNSPVYTGPFELNNSASVQAIAAQTGTPNSAVATASFVDSSATGSGTGLNGSYWTNLTATAFTNQGFFHPANTPAHRCDGQFQLDRESARASHRPDQFRGELAGNPAA